MSHVDTRRAPLRLRRAGLLGLIAALSLCLVPGAAAAKSKKDPPRVATFNLYLGTDLPSLANNLNPAFPGNFASKPDSIGNGVGFALNDINANDFNTRAANIATLVKQKKVDLVGLQEAALYKLQVPTDASGVNPAAQRATLPLIDYVDVLLNALNEKAKTKKECGQAAKKRKAQGKKPKECYRGYRLAIAGNRVDTEFLGDFDNNPGPNGKTFDLSDTASLGAAASIPQWPTGNDDTGVFLGEPTPAQCGDGIDNDGDGDTDYGPVPADGMATPGGNETSAPGLGDPDPGVDGENGAAFPWDCESRADNSETDTTPGAPPNDTNGLPPDTNFDHHALSGNAASPQDGTPACSEACAAPGGKSYDGGANGLDSAAASAFDCSGSTGDTSPDKGPADGTPGWPYSGAGYAAAIVPVCLFHGIDGDLSLTLRDAILVRVGNGVKASNPQNALFTNQVSATLPTGAKLSQNRGWVSVDAKVRGKSFHFVNTHLEATDDGTVREDQATELLSGPASPKPTVLVCDCNSDEKSADPESPPAMNRLLAAGFRDLVKLFSTSGHTTGSRAFLSAAETQGLINNSGDLAVESRIDRVLTNGTFQLGTSGPLDKFAGGLWTSDHAGVFASLGKKPKGKKKK